MANKRKKEVEQHVVVDSMAKANSSTMKSFETTESEIKSKKAHIVDGAAKKVKETRQHLEKFTKEKLVGLEKNCNVSSQTESSLSEASKTAATCITTIAAIEKRLKDLAKFVVQVDLEVKNELQGLDVNS